MAYSCSGWETYGNQIVAKQCKDKLNQKTSIGSQDLLLEVKLQSSIASKSLQIYNDLFKLKHNSIMKAWQHIILTTNVEMHWILFYP